MINEKYIEQVKLLLEVLPLIANEKCFALKGGTAINMFYNNLPRLSVDIDLVYTVIENREESCTHINEALQRLKAAFTKIGLSANITGINAEKKIICSNSVTSIKIEPNYTLRGTVLPTVFADVYPKVEEEFAYAGMNVLAKEEVYAGKICAALDRQHPRDLFDINQLYENGGLTDKMIDVFLYYLLGHNRPVHEVLNCNIQDKQEIMQTEFVGMTDIPFAYEQHCETLERLKADLLKRLSKYYEFISDFVQLKADFSKSPFPEAEKLPALQWKLRNLNILKEKDFNKFGQQKKELDKVFLK
ncbi:MAG: nucleotidyl transferase AbiEii/AbiGii toxin family protein [Treponema sp.]|nr:nucleotidyl transferase AbiEii/AbiGii toxin family protein [Treponema sp.]